MQEVPNNLNFTRLEQIIEETDQENVEKETLYVPDNEKGLAGTSSRTNTPDDSFQRRNQEIRFENLRIILFILIFLPCLYAFHIMFQEYLARELQRRIDLLMEKENLGRAVKF